MTTDMEFYVINKREYAFEFNGEDARCSLERVPRRLGVGYDRGVLAVFRNSRGEQFFSFEFDASFDYLKPREAENIFLEAHEMLLRCKPEEGGQF